MTEEQTAHVVSALGIMVYQLSRVVNYMNKHCHCGDKDHTVKATALFLAALHESGVSSTVLAAAIARYEGYQLEESGGKDF